MYRLLPFFALIALLYACKSKDTTTPNRPPNAFSVTPTLKSDGKTITLNWTKAKDPDGDAVTYTVVLKDTLVKNSSDTTYTISNLDYNYNQAGKVIAKDPKGLTTEASFTATTQGNHVPTNFTVTPTLQTDGKTIVLNWTEAKDPDGGKITYCVVLKDTLVKTLTTNTYTINGLDYNVNQAGKVIAKNTKGLVTESAFTAVTKAVAITTVNIPDANFEKYLVDNKIDKDGVVNGKMNVADAKGVTSINIVSLNIKSLVGIEVFNDLLELNCGFNSLISLDISKNTKLTTLQCSYCSLSFLDVTKNVNLKTLYCFSNNLTSIDVSSCGALTNFWCYSNQLSVLDLSKNVNLFWIDCSNNKITNLNVNNSPKIVYLFCESNSLISLNVSMNTKLNGFNCENNQIKTICVTDVTKANANTNWKKDATATYAICN